MMPSIPSTEKRKSIIVLRIMPIIAGVLLLLTACTSMERYIPGDLWQEMEGAAIIVRVVIGSIGLALLLAGFALYEIIIQIIGFLIGGVLGALLGAVLTSGDATWLGVILGLVIGGSIGAGLALALTYLGVFIAGAFGGVMVFSGLWAALFNHEPGAVVVILGIIVGGTVMIGLFRFWIAAMTAALGAILFGISLGIGPGWWLLLFLIGMGVQYGLANAFGKGDRVKPGYRKPTGNTA